MASDTSNNSPVNLLSLDGGGIRGASQLIILDEIMKRIKMKKHLTEVPKPCEYFHLIGGSGTGGLNAIMLGRLKMSTEDALHNYKKLASAVFSPGNHKLFYKDGKFKANTLEVEIKEIVKNSHVGYTGDELLLDPDAGKGSIGNVFVCAKTSANVESPQRLRTYGGLPNQGPDLRIWEAGRATTATPTIFKAIMVVGLGGISASYIDAGLGHNNPSKEVRDEAKQLFGNDCPVGVFLSIGTGHPGHNGFQQSRGMEKILSVELMKTVTKIATECESVSFDFARQYNSSPGTYFRLNVTHGTGVLAVDDWQREADILAHTNAYLRDPNISEKIAEMIESLCSCSSLNKSYTLGTFAGHITPASRISMVSLPAFVSSLFIGRQEYFSKLEEYFTERKKPWKRRSVLLYGMGGIGKSQIALNFAQNKQQSE
ncbi:acyl transferase/acyl hydrolase/lysophospholipase [Armillaria novae-zelandiae]|uniref:Acyl transferase/acyl hydrolase/lysophospholipase n=1 Tax=Armillaria novae-zelandiae TaxID=153914 RepID=A0AA39KAP8_9AGAR|nr:acyl transferase/acyl hydrolase/lysophospholipase [Armillaria novae-zelandiae]